MTWHTKRNEVPAGGSFLPEDYLQKKAERRTVFISLFLFTVVSAGVVGAFFVTHRRWNDVKLEQERINAEYVTETAKIEQLKSLEKQKAEVIEKAEITTAIKEKVPRSILLAELINRMPKQLTLKDVALKSKRIVQAPPPPPAAGAGAVANRGQATPNNGAPPPPPKPVAPRFEFTIEMTGLASTDGEIADYVTALNECPLLSKVDMLSAKEVTIDDTVLREFQIAAQIKNTADARTITPLQVPRLSGLPGQAAKPKGDEAATTNEDPTQKPTAVGSAGSKE